VLGRSGRSAVGRRERLALDRRGRKRGHRVASEAERFLRGEEEVGLVSLMKCVPLLSRRVTSGLLASVTVEMHPRRAQTLEKSRRSQPAILSALRIMSEKAVEEGAEVCAGRCQAVAP
jgi:hypothetical protein